MKTYLDNIDEQLKIKYRRVLRLGILALFIAEPVGVLRRAGMNVIEVAESAEC